MGRRRIRRAQAVAMVTVLIRRQGIINGPVVLDMVPFPSLIVAGLMPTPTRQGGLQARQHRSGTAVRARTVLAHTATT